MKIGNREFDVQNRTYTMGILNITPDSFSDGGKYNQMDAALKRVETMLEEGMDILDIGGESTRPGYEKLSDHLEIERIIPIIRKVKTEFDIPISLDTYKGRVAEEGIKAGVDLINDIWGLKYDTIMPNVISEYKTPCCLMHNRKNTEYKSFLDDVATDFSESISIAGKAGISDDKIILDPGIGFAKTYQQNLMIINNLEMFHAFGYPLLLGASRKSVIGLSLDLPVMERKEGTLVTTTLAVMKRCAFVRVHDIKENVRTIKMAEAIRNEGQNEKR